MAKAKKSKENTEETPRTPSALAGFSRWADENRPFFIVVGAVLLVAATTFALAKRHEANVMQTATEAAAQAPPSAPLPAELAPDTSPLKDFKVVNAHDHLYSRKYLDKYLNAAAKTGIAKTLFVASSEYTMKGKGFPADKGNDENSEEMIAAAREHPDAVIPFCTIHPGDPEKLDKIKRFVAEGAKGLKLYTGHGNFYDRPLDVEEMMPVYQYCEETALPICWHVNLTKPSYAEEFQRVMARFRNLCVIVPHFGVGFYRPREAPFLLLQKMLDTYPNLYTDTSFGTREIMVAGFEAFNKDPEVFRAFCQKYSDRILYGTDMVVTGNKEKTEQWITDILRACREVLEKPAYRYELGKQGAKYASKNSTNVNGVFRGLALDDAILKKIYETNFEKLFAKP